VRDARLSFAFDRHNLAAFVIAAGRTNGVACDGAAALRTLAKLRPMPAVRRFARAQPHLRRFTFWDSHLSGLGKQENRKTQMRRRLISSRAEAAARYLEDASLLDSSLVW